MRHGKHQISKGVIGEFHYENITLIITEKADSRLASLAIMALQKRSDSK